MAKLTSGSKSKQNRNSASKKNSIFTYKHIHVVLIVFSLISAVFIVNNINTKLVTQQDAAATTCIPLPKICLTDETQCITNPAPGKYWCHQSYPITSGSTILDKNNSPLILRGAHMESSFAFIDRWQKNVDPTQILNSKTFLAMKSWHMNTLRMNISQWIYTSNPTLYMQRLDKVVSDANTAGLYVILDFHDDLQSGSPYGDMMLHKASISWWTMLATHYKNNSKVMYDPINEPKYPTWDMWLNGDGKDIVGYQQIVHAIRSTGSQQIIIVEPGNASTVSGKSTYGTIGSSVVKSSNIVYSKHDYNQVVSGNPQIWDAEWGPILNHYPIYYGEWAVLPNPDHKIFCQNLTSANADQITQTFLAYLKSRSANWTYWDFEPTRLITDYNTLTPTTFHPTSTPWTCQSSAAKNAGAGSDVKQFLLQNF